MRKPFSIKPVADRRRKQLQTYTALKNKYLDEHPQCEICGLQSSEIHHMQGRENKLLLDITKFKALCHKCHTSITEHSKQSIEQGHSISRHMIITKEEYNNLSDKEKESIEYSNPCFTNDENTLRVGEVFDDELGWRDVHKSDF